GPRPRAAESERIAGSDRLRAALRKRREGARRPPVRSRRGNTAQRRAAIPWRTDWSRTAKAKPLPTLFGAFALELRGLREFGHSLCAGEGTRPSRLKDGAEAG